MLHTPRLTANELCLQDPGFLYPDLCFWIANQILQSGMASTLNKNHIAANHSLPYGNTEQILCNITANQILTYGNIEHILCYLTTNQILPYGNIKHILCFIIANQILPYGNTEHILCYITANQILEKARYCCGMKLQLHGFKKLQLQLRLWLQFCDLIKAKAL